MTTLIATSEDAVDVNKHWCRSVELALQREGRADWEFADAVFDDVLGSVPEEARDASRAGEDGANTGVNDAVDSVYDIHRSAGTEVTRSAIYDYFVTVRVWPPEERLPDLASFSVHKELRSKEYTNRRALIAQHAVESSTGRWTMPDLRRWKSERKPPAYRTFLELAEERIRRAVHDAGKPWHKVATDDREAIARVLREIADEVAEGRFV